MKSEIKGPETFEIVSFYQQLLFSKELKCQSQKFRTDFIQSHFEKKIQNRHSMTSLLPLSM